MSRRVSLPGADELFRSTQSDRPDDKTEPPEPEPTTQGSDEAADALVRKPSGRVRHDEKITVYVTADELVDLEHTRLTLRRAHGLAVDRGRLVREAIHLALDDVEAHGAESSLVRRLRDQ
ncbi:MAG: hypothetical protein ACRDQA_13430 [Nocardioidaceae bacterium]